MKNPKQTKERLFTWLNDNSGLVLAFIIMLIIIAICIWLIPQLSHTISEANHNIAGDQPISEIVSNPDTTFNIGVIFGFGVGFVFGVLCYAFYKDIKEIKNPKER